MRSYTTNSRKIFQVQDREFCRNEQAEMGLVVCNTRKLFQTVIGFGGAFTEAAAYTFSEMPDEVQDEFLRLCFSHDPQHPEAGGNAYNLCRTHMQSCDFSLGNYAYVQEGDQDLSHFSIERDKQLLIPFIKCGLAANPDLELIAAPWSPPAYMKSNNDMNRGGNLLPEYYGLWAEIIACYLKAYAEEGITIGRMSPQNEPNGALVWDSCVYSAEQEALFTAWHLKPALEKAGLGSVKLFMWDHNKDLLWEQVVHTLNALKAVGAENPFSGVAFHWYAGDHFEQVEAVSQLHPDLELLSTESCVEYLLYRFFSEGLTHATRQQRRAERYGHDLIGNLASGAQGFIDWNMLLDERGGPNHKGNFCEAPLMYNRFKKELIVNRSYYYLGHVFRFVKPGARRFLTSYYVGQCDCVGFLNPDGQRVLIVMNATNKDASFDVVERPFAHHVELEPHSIMTLTWNASEVEA